ncbi:hypothetical protein ACHAO9_011532 [Fusarium lateritium]
MTEKVSASETKLERFFQKDAVCWEIAAQRLDGIRMQKQKKSDKKTRQVDDNESTTDSDGSPQLAKVETVQDVIKAAETAYSDSVVKKGKAKKTICRIVSWLHSHAQVIDVCIQQEPKTTALVWGSIRFLLQVIVDCEQATEVTADGILLVVQHTRRWSRMAQCFGNQKDVEDALIDLYVLVLDFLQSATKRFQKGSWARLKESTCTKVQAKFAAKLIRLREAETRLDKEAIWESCSSDREILNKLWTRDTPAG